MVYTCKNQEFASENHLGPKKKFLLPTHDLLCYFQEDYVCSKLEDTYNKQLLYK